MRLLRADGALLHIQAVGFPAEPRKTPALEWRIVLTDLTEAQRLNAEALANAKFRAVFDQGLVFMGIMDLEGRLLECNRLAFDACGYRREDEIGRPFWETGWWRASAEVQEIIRDATHEAAAGRTYRGELPYVWGDGSERWTDFILSPVKDEAGRVIFLAPMGRDVTEYVTAKAELAQLNATLEEKVLARTRTLMESEERFRAVAENLGDGLLITDLDDVVLEVNWRLLQMSGYLREEVLGRPAHELFHPPEHASEMKARTAGRAEGQSSRYETELHRKDGSRYWAEITGAPLRDAQGKIFGTVGVIRDISERRAAYEALERMRFSVEHAGDSAFWVSREGRYLYVNRIACTSRGYTREELLGLTVFDLDPDLQPEVWAPHWEELKRQGTLTFESRHRRKDGTVATHSETRGSELPLPAEGGFNPNSEVAGCGNEVGLPRCGSPARVQRAEEKVKQSTPAQRSFRALWARGWPSAPALPASELGFKNFSVPV